VHHRSGKRVEAGNIRDEGVVQHTSGGDDEVRVDLVSAGGRYPPSLLGEHRRSDFTAQPQMRFQLQSFDEVTVIPLNFLTGCPHMFPVGFGCERELVAV